MHVYEELLTFWKYYCVGESESEEESNEEEKKKKKHKKSTKKKSRKTCHKKKKVSTVKSEDSLTLMHCNGMRKPFITC